MLEELSGPVLWVCVLPGCGLIPPSPRVARARTGALRRDRGAGREGAFGKRGAACVVTVLERRGLGLSYGVKQRLAEELSKAEGESLAVRRPLDESCAPDRPISEKRSK